LSVVIETVKVGLSDEFNYQLCHQISQVCGTFVIIPGIETLVFDYKDFCKLALKSDMILDNISSKLVIIKESAMQQAQNFFINKNVIVQAERVQGTMYKVGSYFE
jgi:hypothetical protein